MRIINHIIPLTMQKASTKGQLDCQRDNTLRQWPVSEKEGKLIPLKSIRAVGLAGIGIEPITACIFE